MAISCGGSWLLMDIVTQVLNCELPQAENDTFIVNKKTEWVLHFQQVKGIEFF
jgi:hypothetical protein